MSDFLSDLKARVEALAGILTNQSASGEVDTYYPIKSECQDDVPKIRFRPRVGKTLSERKWNAAFHHDGSLDIAKVLRRIQRGGVHPSIKGEVWEFLLGCYDPNSTFSERNQLRQHRSGSIITTPIITEDGQPIQNISTSGGLQDENGTRSTSSPESSLGLKGRVDVETDKKVIQWKLLLHQIGLDVVRTDRFLAFYESEANQAKLWNVLSVYAWVDGDIGYCQGMNDICSPIVVLLDDEADAFWCFERAMRRLRENFRCSTSHIGVQSQLGTLSKIIKTVDPKLHQHIEDIDGGEYLFAFRMLMVLFRREFSFVDALYLWELMWAMEYNPNIFLSYEKPSNNPDKSIAPKLSDELLKQYGKFERKNVRAGRKDQQNALAVFLVANVLETKNKKLLRDAKGLDDVVKIVGDIIGNLDAKRACKGALKIQRKYLTKAISLSLSLSLSLTHTHTHTLTQNDLLKRILYP
ncbi:rab GTPase-activating protein 22 isoform X2 [Malania oleifera]|uniref:rab GTPase-activating protein 22 isoform X2 n=1 Tax=Malania oleifera TaxID=397392 RepID=UPI0025AEA7BC|nr:rab GTPase-activating protein 22 isoform X2 [Malania oleifera]